MDVETPVALDHTTSLILEPDGTPLQKPCTMLSLSDCRLIRDYRRLLQTLNLQPELFCRDCYTSRPARETQSQVNVSSSEIEVLCGCRLLYGLGATGSPTETGPAVGAAQQLAPWAGRLFLAYARLLRKYRLAEVLRCLTCWQLSVHDGCRARVVQNRVDVECRHRHLMYREGT